MASIAECIRLHRTYALFLRNSEEIMTRRRSFHVAPIGYPPGTVFTDIDVQ